MSAANVTSAPFVARIFMLLVITMREKGVLQSWHANGFGMVSVGEQLYFLHRTNIVDGEPVVGSDVEFDVAPPRGRGRFEQAVMAKISAAQGGAL